MARLLLMLAVLSACVSYGGCSPKRGEENSDAGKTNNDTSVSISTLAKKLSNAGMPYQRSLTVRMRLRTCCLYCAAACLSRRTKTLG